MLFSRDYQKPFWRGFFHALLIVAYTLFISLVVLSLRALFNGEIGFAIQVAFFVFLAVFSIGVCGFLIFYEPMKKLFHQHFKAASVMVASTLGWLFVFMIVFLVGLVLSLSEFA